MSLLKPRSKCRPLPFVACLLCLLLFSGRKPLAGWAQEARKLPPGSVTVSGNHFPPLPVFRHLLMPYVTFLLSPEGRTLVTLERDGAKYWDAVTGRLLWMRPWSPKPILSLPQTRSPQNLAYPYFWKAGNLYWYEIEHETLYCGDMRTNARVRSWPSWKDYGFASDGSRLIRFGRTPGAPAVVFDPITGRRLGSFAPSALSPDMAVNGPVYFSPNGILAAMIVGERAMIWNIQTGARVRVLTDTRKFRYTHGLLGPVIFSPDGQTVVTGAENAGWPGPGDGPHSEASYAHSTDLFSWDLRTGKRNRAVAGAGGGSPTSAPAFSADSKWLFLGGSRWKMPAFTLDRPLNSADWIAFGGSTGVLADQSRRRYSVWDLTAGRRRWILPDPPLQIGACAFSADGLRLATGDSRIRLWDLRTLKITQELAAPVPPDRLDFLPDGRLLSDSRSCAISALLEPASSHAAKRFPVPDPSRDHDGSCSVSAHVSPDGKTVVEQTEQNFKLQPFVIRDVSTGQVRHALPDFSGNLRRSVFTPDGQRYVVFRPWRGAATRREETGALLNLETGRQERVFQHDEGVWPLAISPDSRTLIAGSAGGVHAFDMTTGLVKYTLKQIFPQTAAFSPNGQILALGCGGKIALYAGESPDPVRVIDAPFGEVSAVAFAPDGRRLACVDGGVAEIWQVSEGRLLLTLRVFPNPAESSARSPFASPGSYEGPAAWIAYTPEGFYTGSPNIADYLYWREGTQVYPAAHFPQLLRPDLCRQALQIPAAKR